MKFSVKKMMAKGASVLGATAICLAMGAGMASAATTTESEPNNHFSTANKIAIGNTVYGECDDRDNGDSFQKIQWGPTLIDVYKFTAPANGTVSISVGHENYLESISMLRVWVYDSTINNIRTASALGRQLGAGRAETIQVKKGQTFYMGVEAASWGDPHLWDGETYFLKTAYVVDTPAITKVKGAKKSFKVTHGISLSNTGYQISYKKKGASKWTTKTVKSATAKNFTAKKLKKKAKYKVKVRAFKVAGGKTYYSKWSPTKTVKTK